MSHNTNVSGNNQKKAPNNVNNNGSNSVLHMNIGNAAPMTQLSAASPLKNAQSNNPQFNQQLQQQQAR